MDTEYKPLLAEEKPRLTQEERITAALAHITAIIPTMGIIAPIIIWVTQKEKSKFVNFQALQALVYQLLMLLLWFLMFGCYMGSMFLIIPLTGAFTNSRFPNGVSGEIFVFFPFCVFGFFILLQLFMIIYALVATVKVLQGKDFRYAVVADRLDKYLKSS
jgi:uncharacterized protein